ncbi:MAG TPA: OsmC family protein [Phenylobacterium sp.]
MPAREHRFETSLSWTGDTGEGTASYRSYERAHEMGAEGRAPILGSSDPHFRGDGARWNPELLLVAALSSCHQLWYLHLASQAGVVVTAYEDCAEGWMQENADGSGQMTRVRLRPRVTIAAGEPQLAQSLHHQANAMCFIARSVNFPVAHEAEVVVG